MKLWQKIYLFSLIVVITTISLSGHLLIQNFHNSVLKKEIEKSISEERFLFPLASTTPELEGVSYNKMHYLIRVLDGHYYLYISEMIAITSTPIKVYYARDISDVYIERKNHYVFFFKLDVFLSALFAIFMFFISRLIARPIETLICSTKKLTEGDYSERVQTASKDELGILSEHFNLMAETIEDKVRQLERSNNEKEIFINNFTHELKTPLTSIIGYANFLQGSKYDEQLFFEAAHYIYKDANDESKYVGITFDPAEVTKVVGFITNKQDIMDFYMQ